MEKVYCVRRRANDVLEVYFFRKLSTKFITYKSLKQKKNKPELSKAQAQLELLKFIAVKHGEGLKMRIEEKSCFCVSLH